eukprot:GAHX01001757.1.p1 GENE.GAHX01001757.1~~GAHX01001757.1.p1  ORF type:complete len:418 (+),score=50.78 GAHX01001757.1:76-1329(+)
MFGPYNTNRKVSYFYSPHISSFYYGTTHPMKPHRIAMTHSLISNLRLYEYMEVVKPVAVSSSILTLFHSPDYIEALKMADPLIEEGDTTFSDYYKHKDYQKNSGGGLISPETQVKHRDKAAYLERFVVGNSNDCPSFPGMFEYCALVAGASLGAAVRIASKRTEIAISWMGGLHHAKKREASGFCYVNDIVLAVLELLRSFKRVLYIDIDVHHGDGVEEAFYNSDRVFTLSFHRYGDFFPNSGKIMDIGLGKGRFYAANVPLNLGLSDRNFVENGLFDLITSAVVQNYRPEVIVLQCGADSVSGDHIGLFNLSSKGHGEAIRRVKQFGLPMLVLGGGGYNVKNVSRTWAYETSILCGLDVDNVIPNHEYSHCYAPDYRLHIEPNDMEDKNTQDEIDTKVAIITENLREMATGPVMNL